MSGKLWLSIIFLMRMNSTIFRSFLIIVIDKWEHIGICWSKLILSSWYLGFEREKILQLYMAWKYLKISGKLPQSTPWLEKLNLNLIEEYNEICNSTRNFLTSDYAGNTSITITGKTCQNWQQRTPHNHALRNVMGDHNYCRSVY